MAELELIIWNVEHGLAVSIFTPQSLLAPPRVIAYDAGRSDDFSPLVWVRDQRQVKQLDAFVLSHPHADHLRDLPALMQIPPKVVWRPLPAASMIREAAHGALEETVIDAYERDIDQVYVGAEPFDITQSAWSGGCEISIWRPPFHPNLNNMSLVMFISYASVTVCLPGDLEKPGWDALLGMAGFTSELAKTTILLAPHHGREAGVCKQAFDLMSPQLCVISDGPTLETSTNVYTALASGANVRKNNVAALRRALSTRKDGIIQVRIGPSEWTVDCYP